MTRNCGCALLVLGVAAFNLHAQTEVAPAVEPASQTAAPNQRLLSVARLWVTVKYFHPYLAYKQEIDWDGALVASLPKIIAAKTSDEYAHALADLLAPLHDAETGVPGLSLAPGAAPSAGGQRRWIHFGLPPEDGSPYSDYYSAFELRGDSSGVISVPIPMGEGVTAVVRLTEQVPDDNSPGEPRPPATLPRPRPANSYADQRYPEQELRILAAFKIWGVYKYFFAYRDLLDEDLDVLFLRALPKIRDAKNAGEYNLGVAEFVAHVFDSQATVRSAELDEYFGVAPAPLELRLIEKKPLVTRILDEAAVKGEVKVGDVVLKVDGEDMGDRIRHQAPYISSSTQWWLGERLMQRILSGADGSTVTITVRGPDAKEREVKLTRKAAYMEQLRHPRAGEVLRILNGNIGYADLDRLKADQVDMMFEKFRETKSIIFDLRGTLNGKSPADGEPLGIAPRLTEKQDVPAAIFNAPVLLAPDSDGRHITARSASTFSVQTIPKVEGWKYKGKTLMLVDERTAGAAEYEALFLEAANRTVVVGSPSAGALGDVSNFVLPGGIAVQFTGDDVRHGNSGALQRTGLQPEDLVVPSILGIRRGRDEVLEKALEYLRP